MFTLIKQSMLCTSNTCIKLHGIISALDHFKLFKLNALKKYSYC